MSTETGSPPRSRRARGHAADHLRRHAGPPPRPCRRDEPHRTPLDRTRRSSSFRPSVAGRGSSCAPAPRRGFAVSAPCAWRMGASSAPCSARSPAREPGCARDPSGYPDRHVHGAAVFLRDVDRRSRSPIAVAAARPRRTRCPRSTPPSPWATATSRPTSSLTSDGVLLAFHDSSLDRLTDRVGRIGQLSLDEVREADAGYTFSPDGGLTYPVSRHRDRDPDARGAAHALERRLPQHRRQGGRLGGSAGRARRPAGRVQPRVHRLVLRPPGCAHPGAGGGRICSSMGQVATAMAYAASRTGQDAAHSMPTASRCRSAGAGFGSTGAS